jgi:CxxC motif-containing protein
MKQLLCIVCPNGCRLQVDDEHGKIKVTGNACQRGADFAMAELTNPLRTLTTSVRTVFPGVPVLSVRTAGEIPKGKIREVMAFLGTVVVRERIAIGETVAKNVLGLGVNVIATSNRLKEGCDE